MSMSNVIFVTGTILLLHSAYSCMQYRSLLQGLDEAVSGISIDVLETTSASSSSSLSSSGGLQQPTTASSSIVSVPPIDVLVESLIGFLLIFIAELVRPGSGLLPVVTTSTGKKPKQLIAHPYITRDFDIYTTRARALYGKSK